MTAPRLQIAFPLVALSLAALAACVPAAPQPTPAPAPIPAPAPAPPPVAQQVPTPRYENWMDAPQTPGDWRYAAGSGAVASIARFGAGAPVFAIACLGSGAVQLQRLGVGAPVPGQTTGRTMIVRTEFAERSFPARDTGQGPAIEFPAADSFLEAIAFSKGRFAIETAGAPVLFLPAWPEVSRVIEDCRRGPL